MFPFGIRCVSVLAATGVGGFLEEEGAKGDLIARLFMLWHQGHSILDTCEDFKNHLHHYLFTSDRITVST